MAKQTLELRAQAKRLGVEGYRQMSVSELQDAIKRAEGTGSKPAKTAKRKTAADNGTKPKKTAAKKGTARKTTTSAKSERKSAPAKSKQKSGTAKRPTTTSAKQATSKSSAVGRVAIVNEDIDWTAESNVGGSGGNRAIIMKALRQAKGNVEKVYAKLADKAQTMYPKTADNRKRSKGDAQSLLRWHISRVKFDFVKDTGQHNGVVRAKGKAAPAKTSSSKATGGSKKSSPAKGTRKSTRKSAASQKPAQRATGGKKGAASRKRGK